MMVAVRRILTVLGTPGMLMHYARWSFRFAISPRLTIAGGAKISGFRDFSEYWSARSMIPDPSEVEFIRRFAGRKGVMLDVGANIGVHAITQAVIRPECFVHAFEPSPINHGRLVSNLTSNSFGNVRTYRVALADRVGAMEFDADEGSPATNRLIRESRQERSANVVKVDVTTIDLFMRELGDPEVAFIKIDVEGFEPAVLRGAVETLKRTKCFGLLELCPGNLIRVGFSVEDLFQEVRRCGYEMRFLDEAGNLVAPVEVEVAKSCALCNVALVPSGLRDASSTAH